MVFLDPMRIVVPMHGSERLRHDDARRPHARRAPCFPRRGALETLAVLALAGALVGAARPAVAQNVETARTLSLGGPQRALVTGTDAISTNPAGLAMSSLFLFEGSYFDDFGGGDRRVNASISDSHDKPIAGGVAYTFRAADVARADGARVEVHRIDAALAGRLGDGFTLGVNGHYVTADTTGLDADWKRFSFDVGVQYRSEAGLAVGVVGQNLTATDRPELPLRVGGGLGFAGDMFTLAFDFMQDTQRGRPALTGSGSALLANQFAVRLGGGYDFATEGAQLSFGLGYVTPKVAVDLGYRQRLAGAAAPGLDGERLFGATIRFVALP
jgi:hypothetical protein